MISHLINEKSLTQTLGRGVREWSTAMNSHMEDHQTREIINEEQAELRWVSICMQERLKGLLSVVGGVCGPLKYKLWC